MQAPHGGWATWKKNPLYISHMGSVWESLIYSAHHIFSSMIQTHGRSLEEESLAILMTETKRIMNFQSLTTDNINEQNSSLPLTPSSFNHEIKYNLAISRRFFEN